MDDAALEALLFVKEASPIHARALPDWNYVHRELRRPGVTLMQPERDVAPALELPVHCGPVGHRTRRRLRRRGREQLGLQRRLVELVRRGHFSLAAWARLRYS